MRRMARHSFEANLADAAALAGLLHPLVRLPKPTLALVQGAAYGGGVGLVACCDLAVAPERASFCLSEVKLGLTPPTISPYVVNAIGARWARRLFQTAEVFTAARAREIGLVHEVVPEDGLAAAGERSEEHTSELQSRQYLVCRLLLEKKKRSSLTHSQLCRA